MATKEHIVQFAVGIDDDAIIKYITEKASKDVLNDIKQQIVDKIWQSRYYNYHADPKNDPFSELSKAMIQEIMEQYHDEIVDKTCQMLVKRLTASKKYRDRFDDMIMGDDDGKSV